MPSTLAHPPFLRLVACGLLMTASCTGWTSPGGPAARDEVDELEPAPAGTYRLVGTEQDSRTGATARVVETYVVQPSFERGQAKRQLTSVDDGTGASREWETEYRPAGAFRLREKVAPASWEWTPPLRTLAAPLRVGREWSSAAAATVPDMAGVRRVMELQGRSTVTGTDTVGVDGTRVFAFVIEATLTTTVVDTDRVTEMTTTVVSTATGRTWFAPSRGLTVRSEVRTQVTGDTSGGYTVERRLQVEHL